MTGRRQTPEDYRRDLRQYVKATAVLVALLLLLWWLT